MRSASDMGHAPNGWVNEVQLWRRCSLLGRTILRWLCKSPCSSQWMTRTRHVGPLHAAATWIAPKGVLKFVTTNCMSAQWQRLVCLFILTPLLLSFGVRAEHCKICLKFFAGSGVSRDTDKTEGSNSLGLFAFRHLRRSCGWPRCRQR